MDYWWECKVDCFHEWTSFEREVTFEGLLLYTNHTIIVDLTQDEDGCIVSYENDELQFQQIIGESLTFNFFKDSCDDHKKTFMYQFIAQNCRGQTKTLNVSLKVEDNCVCDRSVHLKSEY